MRHFRATSHDPLEIQEDLSTPNQRLFYIGQKEWIYKDGSFFMEFPDINAYKQIKEDAKKVGPVGSAEYTSEVNKQMATCPKVSFEYEIYDYQGNSIKDKLNKLKLVYNVPEKQISEETTQELSDTIDSIS